MTHPEMDKVTVTAHYDDAGACRQIYVYLNDDHIAPEDVANAVRAVFRPDTGTTVRNHHLDETRAFPYVSLNGHSVAPKRDPSGQEWFTG